MTEDINIVSGSLVASDTITFRDVDLIDTHTAAFAFTSSSSSAPLPGFTNNSTSIGVFALTTVNESNGDTVNTASLGWSFTLNDSHPVLQSLAANQTVTQVYTVTVSDGQGGTVPQTVTVTITGTNDVPVITSGTQSGAVTEIVDHAAGENATMHTQSGAIVFTDVDTLDIHTATFSPAAGNTTTLGTFTLDLLPTTTPAMVARSAGRSWLLTAPLIICRRARPSRNPISSASMTTMAGWRRRP